MSYISVSQQTGKQNGFVNHDLHGLWLDVFLTEFDKPELQLLPHLYGPLTLNRGGEWMGSEFKLFTVNHGLPVHLETHTIVLFSVFCLVCKLWCDV